MPLYTRTLLIAPLLIMLGACSNLTERQYDGCIVGISLAGGGVGSAVSGGSAVLPGIMVGAGVSALICEKAAVAEPMAAATAVDSDGDGVSDANDRCANTPAGIQVDSRGCALDSDGDGVADHLDNCANTPTGVKVDEVGCPLAGEAILTFSNIGFAFDSAQLSAASKASLDAAVETIKSHSSVQLAVVGHTDSQGDASYNQTLSEKRAAAVMQYLISQGVDGNQLSSEGKGESNPIASNDSLSERAQNRRVEFIAQ